MPYRLYLCLAHSIPSPSVLMRHMHQPITNDMIHFISSHDRIGSSILTSLAFHCCLRPSASKSWSSFTATWSIAPKPPTCPSRLQPVHQAKSCLDLLHLSHMTHCHVSYGFKLLHHMCEPCNISKPSSLSWHELLTQVPMD